MLDTRATQTNNHHYVRISFGSFPLSAQIRKPVESGNMVIDIETLRFWLQSCSWPKWSITAEDEPS